MDTSSIQLVASVATVVLTPLLSMLVVSHQLQRSHEFWIEQFRYQKAHEDFKLRVELLETATALLSRFNDLIVHHHVYASSRDTALALSLELSGDEPKVAKYYQNEYENFRSRASESYLQYRTASVELSGLAAVLGVYFGESITTLIHAVRDKGAAAIKSPLPPAEFAAAVGNALQAGKTIEETRDEVLSDYDDRYQTHRPLTETQAALRALFTAVNEAKARLGAEN